MKKGLILLGATAFLLMGAYGHADGCQSNKTNKSDQTVQTAAAETVLMAFDKKPAPGTKAKCPVMGATFTVKEKTEISKHNGKYYAFCCAGCKPQFDKDPAKFLK